MPIFTFNAKMLVGVKTIDDQHKVLVEHINNLYDAMKTGKGKEILDKLLKDLISYARSHFSNEEVLMKTHSYPGSAQHKSEHADFWKKVGEFEDHYKAGKVTLTIEIGQFLSDWIANHIQSVDKKFGAFLKTKGVD